jgi:pseudooxynicotine dehydrogenase
MKDTTDTSSTGLSRRKFISSAAVATGSTTLAASSLAGDKPADSGGCKTAGCDYDVIVIGGGFGGVTAARDSQKNGLKTLLLEARNRLGGRTFTTEFEGHPVELGGTWIHNSQPFVWAEAQRYGTEVVETPGAVADTMVAVLRDDRRFEMTMEQVGEVALGWDTFCAMGRNILPRPYDLLHNNEAALEAEKIGAMEHLYSLKMTSLQHAFNEAMISLFVNGDAQQMSYLEVLRFHQLSGGSFPMLMDATARFQIKGGTTSLLSNIINDGEAEVRLATPVKSVHDEGGKVVVTTARGEELSCGAVVCSVPMNVINSIEFQPPLPGGVVEAGKQGHPGKGLKIYMKVEGDVGDFSAFSPHLAMNFAMTYKRGKGYTIVAGFAPGSDDLDPYDEESVQAALQEYLPEATVLSVMHYDWVNDPYSRGTWATYRTGWVEKYYDQFQQDSGRVFFASGDHGEGWRGTIDSAIGAGLIAARKANDMLS